MASTDQQTSPPLTFFAFVTRNDDLTAEEFQKYWIDHHGPLVGKFLAEQGVISYRQVFLYAQKTSLQSLIL